MFQYRVNCIHFLSTIVFSSEATSLIANRNPCLYDSSVFSFFKSLSVILGKSFLNIRSELTGFFLLFDFFTRFSDTLFFFTKRFLCMPSSIEYINAIKSRLTEFRIRFPLCYSMILQNRLIFFLQKAAELLISRTGPLQ